MGRKIVIEWDDWSQSDYRASLEAMRSYSPPPAIKSTVRLKGVIGPDALDRLMSVAEELDMKPMVRLEMEAHEGTQLRLFPSPRREAEQAVARGVADLVQGEGIDSVSLATQGKSVTITKEDAARIREGLDDFDTPNRHHVLECMEPSEDCAECSCWCHTVQGETQE